MKPSAKDGQLGLGTPELRACPTCREAVLRCQSNDILLGCEGEWNMLQAPDEAWARCVEGAGGVNYGSHPAIHDPHLSTEKRGIGWLTCHPCKKLVQGIIEAMCMHSSIPAFNVNKTGGSLGTRLFALVPQAPHIDTPRPCPARMDAGGPKASSPSLPRQAAEESPAWGAERLLCTKEPYAAGIGGTAPPCPQESAQ